MFLLKKIVASLVLPPTGPLLLAFFGLWLARRRPRTGRWLVALATGLLLLLSVPWFSQALLRGLEDGGPISPAAHGRDTVSNGKRATRGGSAARVPCR